MKLQKNVLTVNNFEFTKLPSIAVQKNKIKKNSGEIRVYVLQTS